MRFLYAILSSWLWLWFTCIMIGAGIEITGDAALISISLVAAGALAGGS